MGKERSTLALGAVKINGSYLEDLIAGYATLNVIGRMALEKQVGSYEVGASDGARYKSSRYPARTIKIEYLIHSETEDDLIIAVNQLSNILSVEEADFVFNDEPDLFFTGVPVLDPETEKHPLAVHGSFSIFCAYPFKRSVATTILSSEDVDGVTAGASSVTFTFNYDGTYPARPMLRAEFAAARNGGDYSEDGDCGFVAFLDDEENIIQLGNPEAVDVDQYAKNGTLINSEFSDLTSWAANNVTCEQIIDTYWDEGTGQTQYYAKPSGTASLTRTTAGASDHEFDIVHRLCISDVSETGTFEALAKNNGVIVVGFRIEKAGNGNGGIVKYILNDKVVGTDDIDLSYYNTNFGFCSRTAVYVTKTYKEKVVTYVKKNGKKKKVTKKVKKTKTVRDGWSYTQSNLNSGWSKDGGTVVFSVGDLPDRTFKCSDIESTISEDIALIFSGSMHTNAVHSCSFIAKAGVPFAEIPNVFTAGDIVEADCNDASVVLYRAGSLEGHLEPKYGALGNDWEDFLVKPGQNVIQAAWSDWVDPSYKPAIKIIFNEVYL